VKIKQRFDFVLLVVLLPATILLNFMKSFFCVEFEILACFLGLLYCIGGVTKGGGNTNTAEYYDSNFAEWQLIAPMPMARSGLTAVVVNGFIYAIGKYLAFRE